MTAAASGRPLAATIGRSVEDHGVRRADVRELPFGGDALEVQDQLLQAVIRANDFWWGFDLTHVRKMEVCRYGVGDGYVPHMDLGPDFTTRKLSLAVLLNDPEQFEGGEWVFTASHLECELSPTRGMIVVFPSFVLHSVRPVTRGERWSATAWVEGPPLR